MMRCAYCYKPIAWDESEGVWRDTERFAGCRSRPNPTPNNLWLGVHEPERSQTRLI